MALIKTTVLEMVSYIGTTFPVDKGLFVAVYRFFEEKDDKAISTYVGLHIKPLAAYVLRKDLDFFASKKYEVFSGIPKPHIDRLSEMVLASPPESIDVLWTYFSTILTLYDITTKVKVK